jgi:hypothetical protein
MQIAEDIASITVKELVPVKGYKNRPRRRNLSIVRNIDDKKDIFQTWSMPEQPAGYMPVKKKDLL